MISNVLVIVMFKSGVSADIYFGSFDFDLAVGQPGPPGLLTFWGFPKFQTQSAENCNFLKMLKTMIVGGGGGFHGSVWVSCASGYFYF